MESNGKSFDIDGNKIHSSTGPIVWGGLGNQAQHSYYQLLIQSNHKIAADFITIKEFDNEFINSSCKEKLLSLSGNIPMSLGNRIPINHIQIESCSPSNLGSLVALYEHKVFTQAMLWGINPFDQPGVEMAKQFHRDSKSFIDEMVYND